MRGSLAVPLSTRRCLIRPLICCTDFTKPGFEGRSIIIIRYNQLATYLVITTCIYLGA